MVNVVSGLLLIHLDLPVARLQVKPGEPLQSLQAIKGSH